ncbi:N-acetylglucosaminyldiphosphodolichol N-acetylglucosaminyltransferase catalytic subunit alg13 [Xanthoria parietina]
MTQKICFVTIGATAAFDQLLHAVLTSQFLQTLRASGYTNLLLQYGTAGYSILKSFEAEVASGEADNHGIDISGFDFNKLGLGVEMSLVKAADDRAEGVVISHAGSGSILDAMRIDVPLIAVPNTSLLHNHQVDLAEELARQGYLVHGHLDNLSAALAESDVLRKTRQTWPPQHAGADPSGRGLAGVMDDEMGFYD